MSDKMTPGMLRDLADIFERGEASSDSEALREEAARREAEAKELGRTSEREDHSRPLTQGEREGPGSAAAFYTDTLVCPPDTNADHWAWFLSERSPEYAAVRICEMLERIDQSRRAMREELAKALGQDNAALKARVARLGDAIKSARMRIGARIDDMTPAQREAAINSAWHLLSAALAEAPDAQG
jgi:hypothetical protein